MTDKQLIAQCMVSYEGSMNSRVIELRHPATKLAAYARIEKTDPRFALTGYEQLQKVAVKKLRETMRRSLEAQRGSASPREG